MSHYSLETRTADRTWKVQGTWTTLRTAREHFAATVANSGAGLTIRVAEYEERPYATPTTNPVTVHAITETR